MSAGSVVLEKMRNENGYVGLCLCPHGVSGDCTFWRLFYFLKQDILIE
jgi:hypothetical protein